MLAAALNPPPSRPPGWGGGSRRPGTHLGSGGQRQRMLSPGLLTEPACTATRRRRVTGGEEQEGERDPHTHRHPVPETRRSPCHRQEMLPVPPLPPKKRRTGAVRVPEPPNPPCSAEGREALGAAPGAVCANTLIAAAPSRGCNYTGSTGRLPGGWRRPPRPDGGLRAHPGGCSRARRGAQTAATTAARRGTHLLPGRC